MSAASSSTYDPSARGPDEGARRPRRFLGLRAGLAVIAALAAMAIAAPAASAAPWACDGAGYITQFDALNPTAGTAFTRADRQPDGTYDLNVRGTYANHLNAIGFRPQDGLMYGWDNTTSQVVRIEQNAAGDATFAPMGNPPGSGIGTSAVGGVLADGTFLVWAGSSGAIFDVSGPTAQLVTTVTGAEMGGDFAVSPIDGQIYSLGREVPGDPTTPYGYYQFTLSGDTLTRGPRVAEGLGAGAGFFQADGTYIIYVNGTTPDTPPEGAGVYSINLTTGQRTFLGSGPVLSNVDGASCANGLAFTKDASPRTVTAGTEVTYTYTMTSRALIDNQVDFVDQLPAGLSYVSGGVSVAPAFGSVNNYGGTGRLEVSGTMSPGQTVTITARVLVSPDHACNANVNNQAQATMNVPGLPGFTAPSDDPTTPADPDDDTTIHVNCAADVKIDKTASTSPIVPGEDATFQFVATNHGPSTAQNVAVSDQLPAEFTFASASQGCAEANGTLTCTVGSLAPGASQTFTVTGGVASSLDECLENTATVSSTTPDPNAANNSSTICTPIRGRSNLSISKTASRATLPPGGGQVMYTIVVENDGPSDDPGVKVSDPMEPRLTLVAAEPSQGTCSTANNAVACDLGRLKDGGSAQVLVTVNVAADAGCVPNTAKVQGAREDPDPSDNQASAQVCVEPTPEPPTVFDLEVDKRASVSRPVVGQRVTYRIVVTNNGPDAAPEAKVTDTYNSRASVVSVRTTQGSCTRSLPITCELGRIEAGASATITMVIRPRETGRARNAASATSCCGTDPDPSNNMDTADIRVRKVTLKLSKIASRSSVAAGETFSYRIRVRNPTKGQARNVKVCDRLPSGLSFVSSQPRAKRSGSQRCWTIKRLKAGKSKTFRVTVRASRGANGRKTNRATANSPDTKRARARDGVRVLGVATPVTG